MLVYWVISRKKFGLFTYLYVCKYTIQLEANSGFVQLNDTDRFGNLTRICHIYQNRHIRQNCHHG